MVQMEEVRWIVAAFDSTNRAIVAAERGRLAVLTVVLHHHVDVAAAGRAGVQILPIVLCRAGRRGKIRWIRIDAGGDAATQPPLRYAKVVAIPGHLAAAPLIGYMCIVDSGAGITSPVSAMYRNGLVGDLLEEVDLPIPLQSLGHQCVEGAPQHRVRHRR